MRCRLLLTAVLATALLASGCSGDKPAQPASSTSATASATAQPAPSAAPAPVESSPAEAAPAPADQLDASACVEVTGANLDLAVATNAEDARKAADTFEKYNPPSDVKEAIEHFANTNGAQFDDPDYDRYNTLIDNWVKQICPL
jgi:hypothetical protein